DALLRLVSLANSARKAVTSKVRQPLAELRVAAGTDAERRAVARFAEQMRDELNVKAVSLHDPAAGPMLRTAAKLNPRTAKSHYKGKPEAAAAELTGLDGAKVQDQLKTAGTFPLLGVELTADDLLFETAAPDGWAGVADRSTQVMLDTRITPELKAEGLSRDVIRLVQDARKTAKLDVSDHIELYLGTDAPDLAAAIAAHRVTIAGETQAVRWADAPPTGDDVYVSEPKKLDGHPLTIALRKV
ncbi:MAG: DUF5915 domain-containing protein, partial [Fimbriiglobus sp.]